MIVWIDTYFLTHITSFNCCYCATKTFVLGLFIHTLRNKEHNDVNLRTSREYLSINFRSTISVNHYSSISFIRYLTLTKWTLYYRIGQLGLNGLGGEEDINAAPAHYRVRERRERRCKRTTFRQRVSYTAQTSTSYYLLVFCIVNIKI